MITPEKILNLVCAEFQADPARVLRNYNQLHDYEIGPIKWVYWYLCCLYLPVVRNFGPGTKSKIVQGGITATARAIKVSRPSLRKALREIEERREDPDFDMRLVMIEIKIQPNMLLGVAA